MTRFRMKVLKIILADKMVKDVFLKDGKGEEKRTAVEFTKFVTWFADENDGKLPSDFNYEYIKDQYELYLETLEEGE